MTNFTSKVASFALFAAVFVAVPAGADTVTEPKNVWGAILDVPVPAHELATRNQEATVRSEHAWGAQFTQPETNLQSQAQLPVTAPNSTAPRL
jgi:hypothetical protein